MSLLMDALKKAEKAQQGSVDNAPDDSTLSTTPAQSPVINSSAELHPTVETVTTEPPSLAWEDGVLFNTDAFPNEAQPNTVADQITSDATATIDKVAKIDWDAAILPEFRESVATDSSVDAEDNVVQEDSDTQTTALETDSHSIDWDDALITDYHNATPTKEVATDAQATDSTADEAIHLDTETLSIDAFAVDNEDELFLPNAIQNTHANEVDELDQPSAPAQIFVDLELPTPVATTSEPIAPTLKISDFALPDANEAQDRQLDADKFVHETAQEATKTSPANAGLNWGFDVNAQTQSSEPTVAPLLHQPSPAAAQRVFKAHNKTRTKTRLLSIVLAGMALLSLLGAGGFAWYLYHTQLGNNLVPPQTLATAPQQVDLNNLPIATVAASEVSEAVTPSQPKVVASEPDNGVNFEHLPGFIAKTLSVLAEKRLEATDTQTMPIDNVTEEQPIPSRLNISQGTNTPLNPDNTINNGVENVQKTGEYALSTQLNRAYQAFQRGNDRLAQQVYQQIHQQQPVNRDALLGLAAVAMRQGQLNKATDYYRQTLRLYPQDRYAQAGLISAQGQLATPDGESRLKQLLQQSPNSDYLHFNLGSLYASQGRWHDAQQAFFQAFHQTQDQADYAYNLAVSLEHLNQAAPALQYYQTAWQLAQKQAVSFDRARLRERLQRLRQHVQVAADGVYRVQ